MKSIVYFLSIVGFAVILEASEGPAPAQRMVTLVSSDGKKFEIPLEIFQTLKIDDVPQDRDSRMTWKSIPGHYNEELLNISGNVLAEVVQLMWMAYRYKNLDENQLVAKAKREIPITDNYAFAIAVKKLNFKPGIDLIARKSEKLGDSFQRGYVLEIIKELAPDLYRLIIARDPRGLRHISPHHKPNSASVSTMFTGLPHIYVSSDLVNGPQGELRFVMAHELGHYVLKHGEAKSVPSFSQLKKQIVANRKRGWAESDVINNTPVVSGQLPFKETFENAFDRAKEFEADRFAIMELGASIDDGIAWMKRELEEQLRSFSKPEKQTFKDTHPLWPARIKQLESLRAEVELNKARGMKPKPIDWEGLVESENEWK